MRRILPLLFLAVGFAILLVSDTAEARHHRRRCRQQCCPCYPAATATYRYCPMYKMMQMGGLNHYYTLEYPTDCSGSGIPVSYDTTDSIACPCTCTSTSPPDNCCFNVSTFLRTAATSNNGDHIHGHGSTNPGVNSNIPANESFESNAAYSSNNLQKDKDFLVEVNAGNSTTFWVHAARFKCKIGPNMDLDVGYQVAPGDPGTLNVTLDKTSWVADADLPNVGKLTITGADPKYNGKYQVVRAH